MDLQGMYSTTPNASRKMLHLVSLTQRLECPALPLYVPTRDESGKRCCALQADAYGCCRLHESTFPLSQDLVDELESDLQPFCAVVGLQFQECDERHGPWRNYYVGVVGDVGSEEDDVLWPNRASMQASALPAWHPKCMKPSSFHPL